jgi:phosphoribosylformylglycinamidine synthase
MPEDLNAVLLKLLESPNICSKEWIYQQYDHEVQIRTVIKPGKDAAVLKVDEAYPVGVAVTTDCNSRFAN